MATIILKNTTLSDKTWGGITVLASNQYTVQEVDRLRLLSDSVFLSDLSGGSAVINDGTSNLSATIGLYLLKLDAIEGRFNNQTNGFVSTNIQTAIEEVRSNSSVPGSDQELYVSKYGNDTTGNGSLGRPYLTIAKALTVTTDASPTKRYVIEVGPGDYNENLVLKANFFIRGRGPLATRITGSTININEATWNVTSADNRSGIMDATLNNVATWDFTAQTNNTDGKLYFWNIRTGAAWTATANNAINQLIIQDSQLFGTTTFNGMNSFVSATAWQSGNIVLNSSATSGIPALLTVVGGRISGNISATWTSNNAVTLTLAGLAIGTTTTLTASGASCTVNVNDASLPVPANRTFSSSAVLVRLNDNFAGGLLSATTNVSVSAATAPLAGQSLVASNSTTATWAYVTSLPLSEYGDGSDGDVSLSSGTTNLSRTMYYNNLTLSSTAILNANTYKIYVKGTLTISGTASISVTPNIGGNGSGATAGTGATLLNGNDMGDGLAGQPGSNGAAGGIGGSSGVAGNAAGSASGYGNAGGASGAAGSGAAGAAGTYTHLPERIIRHDHLLQLNYKNGGQGGAGGAGGAASALANGGGGGGGGGGGAVIMIFANTINNTSSTGIVCRGGAGGNGGNAPSGNSVGGGGGGGGGGGQIYIICNTATAIGTLTVTGGAGGTGGNGAGSGSNGSAGSAGSTGHTTVYVASTNTWTVT